MQLLVRGGIGESEYGDGCLQVGAKALETEANCLHSLVSGHEVPYASSETQFRVFGELCLAGAILLGELHAIRLGVCEALFGTKLPAPRCWPLLPG